MFSRSNFGQTVEFIFMDGELSNPILYADCNVRVKPGHTLVFIDYKVARVREKFPL